MRIISDFKDYYDSAQGFGSDPNLTYMRKREHYEYEVGYWLQRNPKAGLPRELREALGDSLQIVSRLPHSLARPKGKDWEEYLEVPVTVKLIGFCGFLYPALEMGETVFYSTEQIASGLPEEYLRPFHLNRQELELILSEKFKKSRFSYRRTLPLTHEFWKDVVAGFAGKRFDEIFVALGIPAFKLEYAVSNKRHDNTATVRCTLNPALKEDRFQRVKGPVEAFQEISMYLGNQLARQPDPVSPVSDEIMRDEKGFNEWSFRRHREESAKYRKRKQNDPQD